MTIFLPIGMLMLTAGGIVFVLGHPKAGLTAALASLLPLLVLAYLLVQHGL